MKAQKKAQQQKFNNKRRQQNSEVKVKECLAKSKIPAHTSFPTLKFSVARSTSEPHRLFKTKINGTHAARKTLSIEAQPDTVYETPLPASQSLISTSSCRIIQVNKSLPSSRLHKGKREQSFRGGGEPRRKAAYSSVCCKEKQLLVWEPCIRSSAFCRQLKFFNILNGRDRDAECLMFIDPRQLAWETMNFSEGEVKGARTRRGE